MPPLAGSEKIFRINLPQPLDIGILSSYIVIALMGTPVGQR